MTKKRLLRIIHNRAARVAVGPSATRGRGTRGVAKKARRFLRQLNLTRFATRDQAAFSQALDRSTAALARALRNNGGSWGLARKLLNIFLRDCLYNAYLRKAYRLAIAERIMEIPLDSITAEAIRRHQPTLRRWTAVKDLRPQLSAAYQAAALEAAKRKRVARVHLDAHWQGGRE